MWKLLLKSSLVFVVLNTSVHSHCNSYQRFDRWIKNNSNQNWIIVNHAYNAQTRYLFDGNPARGPKACEGLFSSNGPCILAPGKITYVTMEHVPRSGEHCKFINGRLYFSNGSHKISVDYRRRNDGIKMESSDEGIINDNHGDITISANR